MKNKHLAIRIQCLDPSGIRGTFLVDKDTGQQATKTFDSAWRLFNSDEYKRLKETNEIDLSTS